MWVYARCIGNVIDFVRKEMHRSWMHENLALQHRTLTTDQRVWRIHMAPVCTGWVDRPRDHRYNSARDHQVEPG